jgi:hypothetical protein
MEDGLWGLEVVGAGSGSCQLAPFGSFCFPWSGLFTSAHPFMCQSVVQNHWLTQWSRVLSVKLMVAYLVKKFPIGSLPCSQEPITGPCPTVRWIQSISWHYSFKIQLNIVIPSTLRSSKLCHPLRFSDHILTCTAHLSCAYHLPSLSHLPWFEHTNNIRWGVQIICCFLHRFFTCSLLTVINLLNPSGCISHFSCSLAT